MLRTHHRERAVSPVIGVILMVAITVILSAIVGVFVLGLGDAVQETPPNVQLEVDWNGEEITITHVSGSTLDPGEVRLVNDNGFEAEFDDSAKWDPAWNEPIAAGDSATVSDENIESGDYRIVWRSGGSSSVLKSFTIPE